MNRRSHRRIGMYAALGLVALAQAQPSSALSPQDDDSVARLFTPTIHEFLQARGPLTLSVRKRTRHAQRTGIGLPSTRLGVSDVLGELSIDLDGLRYGQVLQDSTSGSLQPLVHQWGLFSFTTGIRTHAERKQGVQRPTVTVRPWTSLPGEIFYLAGRHGPLPSDAELHGINSIEGGLEEARYFVPMKRRWILVRYAPETLTLKHVLYLDHTFELLRSIEFLGSLPADGADVVTHPLAVVRSEVDPGNHIASVTAWVRVEADGDSFMRDEIPPYAMVLLEAGDGLRGQDVGVELPLDDVVAWREEVVWHERAPGHDVVAASVAASIADPGRTADSTSPSSRDQDGKRRWTALLLVAVGCVVAVSMLRGRGR